MPDILYKGTIIESSLADLSVLDSVQVLKKYQSGSWTLYDVLVSEVTLKIIGTYLNEGPWYMHFWREGKDEVCIVFKENFFKVKPSEKETWKKYIAYGLSIGIPEKQLTFKI